MNNLLEEFKKYKEAKLQYEKELAIYESKMSELVSELKESFKTLDLKQIGLALGREINIDFSIDLEDKEAVSKLFIELSKIKSEYEDYIRDLMKEV